MGVPDQVGHVRNQELSTGSDKSPPSMVRKLAVRHRKGRYGDANSTNIYGAVLFFVEGL